MGGADVYSVTRGEIASLAQDQYGPCRAEGLETTSVEDLELPGPGQGFFYLVAAQSFDCGSGPLGFTSAEVTRQNLDPGACVGQPHTDARTTGENSVFGTVNGSLPDTTASDDLVEAITEEESSGNPNDRFSRLEHHWTIDVAAGTRVEFHVEGFRTSSADGDDFVFEYSTDGQSWNSIPLTALVLADDDIDLIAPLPASLAGPVTFRVVDTDRTPGALALDTVSIDEVFVRATQLA